METISRMFPNFGPKNLKKMMKGNVHMKKTTNRIYLACALFAFACFALSPITEAADDGNTKLGKDALKANTTGTNDTALGYHAMRSNRTGI